MLNACVLLMSSGVKSSLHRVQASAAAPATKRPSAGEVKHGDISGGVAMKVKGKAPAEPHADGSTSVHDMTPQSKRQKGQSPG